MAGLFGGTGVNTSARPENSFFPASMIVPIMGGVSTP
jgi:hypothetical protein